MTRSFNLVTEPWIPIAGQGLFSLMELFERNPRGGIGGDPVQKIALHKLLFAIAQAACTPTNTEHKAMIGREGMKSACIDYLLKWKDRFDLYSDTPFLQMPAVKSAREVHFDVIRTEIASGNTVRLGHYQIGQPLSDADKALLLVSQMAMSLGGKKPDNTFVLTPGYTAKTSGKGRGSSAKAGPGIGFMGFLHSFCMADAILDTLWINLLTHEQISSLSMFPEGLGIAPWEKMPEGEDCTTARQLKDSLMGRLVSLSRFCLVTDKGMHFTEGLAHKSYLEGMNDPTVSINYNLTKPKAMWANPATRPWRELTSLLSFFDKESKSGFYNAQLKAGVENAINVDVPFAVWSGGLRVTSNAGEQFPSGDDDFIESTIWLDKDTVGALFFAQLKREMELMNAVAKVLYGSVCQFKTELGAKPSGPDFAARATTLFWNRCESLFNKVVMACDQSEESKQERQRLRQQIADHCIWAYGQICDNGRSRNMDAWAKHTPRLHTLIRDH